MDGVERHRSTMKRAIVIVGSYVIIDESCTLPVDQNPVTYIIANNP